MWSKMLKSGELWIYTEVTEGVQGIGAFQTAFQDDGVKTERIVSISQEECQLSWSLESDWVNDDLVFIISGIDLGGKINLISSAFEETILEMTSSMSMKYLKMKVIAVGSLGALDIQSAIIEPKNKCDKIQNQMRDIPFKIHSLVTSSKLFANTGWSKKIVKGSCTEVWVENFGTLYCGNSSIVLQILLVTV